MVHGIAGLIRGIGMRERLKKCGLGMYTVHKSVEENMYETFCGLAQMGYRGIEFYGEPEADLDLLTNSLSDSGLALTGWHVEWRNLQKDRFARTADYLQKAGCPVAVIPCLGGKWQVGHGPQRECRDIWLSYAREINRICARLRAEGIRTGYHNHEHEFALSYDGKKVFDLLFENLDEDVIMEFDSGNCIEGGDDPLRVLAKYRTREKILHLKPYSKTRGFDVTLGEAGDANDWKAILDPENAEYLWFLVESENEGLPEMENARLCMQGLKKFI